MAFRFTADTQWPVDDVDNDTDDHDTSVKGKRKAPATLKKARAGASTAIAAAASSRTTAVDTTATATKSAFDDVELDDAARRRFAQIDQRELHLFGIDFDEIGKLGGGSAKSSRSSLQQQRAHEMFAALLGDAKLAIESDRVDDAFTHCVEAVRLNARAKEPYLLLASIMERKSPPDYRHAIDYLLLAAQFHRRDVALWSDIAEKACLAQDFENATLAYRMILKYGENVDRGFLTRRLALCYELNHDDDKAHKTVVELAKIDKVARVDVIGVAQLLYRHGEVERAIEYMCKHISALNRDEVDCRANFANVVALMYRENYLHQECVAFLGHLLGAPRSQYQGVVDCLIAEANAVVEREAAWTNGPAVADSRKIPAMLPFTTSVALGLVSSVTNAANVKNIDDADDDDDDDDEVAFLGAKRSKAPARTTATATVEITHTRETRVLAADGTVLLNGNVELGSTPPSIDLVTLYACSLAECVGLESARTLLRHVLSFENCFDLHVTVARAVLESGGVEEARTMVLDIYRAMKVVPNDVQPAFVAQVLNLYTDCCVALKPHDPIPCDLHLDACASFPFEEPIIVCVAETLERAFVYERAYELLNGFFQTLFGGARDAVMRNAPDSAPDDVVRLATRDLVVRFPKLVALYAMMKLFVDQNAEEFMLFGKVVLSCGEFAHAPLSDVKWCASSAQRAHLRARQNSVVTSEVQSLIVALGPTLFADLCAQVGYFFVVGTELQPPSAVGRGLAFRLAESALTAQRLERVGQDSRRLSRAVRFDDNVAARLNWVAACGAASAKDRVKFARQMVKLAPNSMFTWQLLLSDSSLHSLLQQTSVDAEKEARSDCDTEASATPLTVRGIYLLKQNQLMAALKVFDEALRRRPNAPLTALLVAITVARQASTAHATPDTLAQVLAAFHHYSRLRLPEAAPELIAAADATLQVSGMTNVPASIEQYLPEEVRQLEVYYNTGRALHQLGFVDHAEMFYVVAYETAEKLQSELGNIVAHNLAVLHDDRGEKALAALWSSRVRL